MSEIASDPKHLGSGWAGFDFSKAFGKPVQVINDAALQALGSFRGGRMPFLGLGTGLGSALVWRHNVLPLELGDLPHDGATIEDRLGAAGLDEIGRKRWQREVKFAAQQLKLATIADYVVLGGGNAKLIDELPPGIELGHNRNAYLGGCRLLETDNGSRRPSVNQPFAPLPGKPGTGFPKNLDPPHATDFVYRGRPVLFHTIVTTAPHGRNRTVLFSPHRTKRLLTKEAAECGGASAVG